jgi:hypothetical protein
MIGGVRMSNWLEVVEGGAALLIGMRVFASGAGAKAISRRMVLIVIAAIFILVGLLLIFDSHAVDTPVGLWH